MSSLYQRTVLSARRSLATRLVLAGAMAAFLLLALAYWWLDNLPHELFGTAMFLLISRHVYQNRNWFRNLSKGRYGLRRTIVVAFHLALLANMIVLLATSLAISRSVLWMLRFPDAPLLSEIHWFSAYWVTVAVGIHLGLNWTRVMAMVRSAMQLSDGGSLESWFLRAFALAVVVAGVTSLPILGIWTKLTFNYSLDFWDFNASVMPFFARWASVLGLAAVASYYVDGLFARGSWKRRRLR